MRSNESDRSSGDALLWSSLRSGALPTAVLLLSVLAGTAATVALPGTLAAAVDDALTGRTGHATLVFLSVLALLTAAETGTELAEPWTAATNTARLSRHLVRHTLALGLPGTRRFGTGDLVSRLVAGAPEAGGAAAALGYAAVQTAASAAALVALARIDPWPAVVVLAGVPAGLIAVRLFVRRASQAAAAYQQAQADLLTRLLDALAGLRTIRAGATTDHEIARILRPLPDLDRAGRMLWADQRAVLWRTALLLPALQLGTLAVAGAEAAAGRVTPGELLAAVGYTTLALGFLGSAQSLLAFARARAGAGRLAEVLAEPTMPPGNRELPEGGGELTFRKATVRIGGETVLDRVSCRIPAGATVAVVGPSGAGKSTLAALAGRLLDPDGGEVLLDGVPLREIRTDLLRRAVTYALPRPVLLGDTVADALAYTDPPGPGPQNIRSAARDAEADAFIRRLPQGYDTPVHGLWLSGGQAQRLGLARAIARGGRLLILDDATSSLDTATEARIDAAVRRALRGRTRLVVAHRASTAAQADLVAWLDTGRLRALAPHRVLREDPAYRALFASPSGLPRSRDRPSDGQLCEPGPANAADQAATDHDADSHGTATRAAR
ncbi:ABC transporter ATP-binding protein [Kitasatospora sp. GP82]|uniref:ABC transporter ATP-binding protein n=1 Tax=Kitasatospora sp. GP82 TaxID=3035089 RepID=UPI00247551E9|nr:ABC transporter ATP-binding protein [Kitasatospora sp. GP82]MDH6126429.1 ATP-binding cassette subfamily B protein [Kitasatospora sp. GP82]